MFQSSPSPGAGRCAVKELGASNLGKFQSSPSPGAGRCGELGFIRPFDEAGFNPRPARGPGAARRDLNVQRGLGVSILAQPGGRALLWRSLTL